ncbi:hypothetical protein [Corynebacterium sp. HS2168-gen11]|uniref:hypothetical protein n=1 Tax=Corynebacterium sp. HS2168-gen11 TaxID=2974027 RepID=UPI00216B1D4E|nr:hypothetical protein [Corynebacterium sp. HS2168-gen11]MCS4535478.1 hypothetical protein [Corynebacterium sp. HS2168-gen11]
MSCVQNIWDPAKLWGKWLFILIVLVITLQQYCTYSRAGQHNGLAVLGLTTHKRYRIRRFARIVAASMRSEAYISAWERIGDIYDT